MNAINKTLRDLQKEVFMKDRLLQECKQSMDERLDQLRKEKQKLVVEQMEKDLKIQFL